MTSLHSRIVSRPRRPTSTVIAVAVLALSGWHHTARPTFASALVPSPFAVADRYLPAGRRRRPPVNSSAPACRWTPSRNADCAQGGRRTSDLPSTRLDKTERIAVDRFTNGFEKLCKTCPTRLRPRVDTLAEMIAGLPEGERRVLLEKVRWRLEEKDGMGEEGLRTPLDVYGYQLALGISDGRPPRDDRDGGKSQYRKREATHTHEGEDEEEEEKRRISERKLRTIDRKMEKARAKLHRSEIRMSRTVHLLDVTTTLLQGDYNKGDTRYVEEDDEEIDELRAMARPRLKLQRLKYLEVRAKCERARAKYRRKRYAASLDLAEIKMRLARNAVG